MGSKIAPIETRHVSIMTLVVCFLMIREINCILTVQSTKGHSACCVQCIALILNGYQVSNQKDVGKLASHSHDNLIFKKIIIITVMKNTNKKKLKVG